MRFSLPRKLYAVLVITAVLPLTVAVMEAVDTFEHWTKSEYRLELQVIDNGTGIAAKDVSKALKPFVQLDGGFDRKHEGTGLGLPLTKALVEQHGGSLDLQGEVDVGTTVTVRFPAQRIVDFPAEIQALAAVASGTD